MAKAKTAKKIVRQKGKRSAIVKSVVATTEVRSLEAKKPDAAIETLELMAQGMSWRKVREQTGVSFAGQAGLKARNGAVLAIRREEMALDGFETAEKLRMLVSDKAEMLSDDEDALKKTSIKDLVLARAIEQDKAFAAIGENTVVVEHRKVGPSLADAQEFIESMKAQVRAEAIDVTPEVEV